MGLIRSRSSAVILGCALVLSLTACESRRVSELDLKTRPHYWQRADATSAIYQRGPKAQQMLNRDISRCVVEIRELERLGAVRRATPADTMKTGQVPDPDSPAGELAQWETPERDGMLRAEHLDYHDFETCMMDKGWELVDHVPYDVAEAAREVYIETILGQQYRTKTGTYNREKIEQRQADSDFGDLND